MKKVFFFYAVFFFVLTISTQAQFTKEESVQIQKILGNDLKAVLGKDGQLAIVEPKSVANIKSAPRGGFTGLPGNAASATLAGYEKFWVYKQSGREKLIATLGQERFNQLSKIMQEKGLCVN